MRAAQQIALVPESLAARALSRARGLCRAMQLEARLVELEQLCLTLMDPWGLEPIGERPKWPSQVVDDGTPFEFSVVVGAKRELRFMVEPLGEDPSLTSNALAAMVLLERLEREYAVDLSRLASVVDLFFPHGPQGTFSAWLAVGLGPSGPPGFKLYLNPQARGVAEAPRVLEEAMSRLGFSEAWPLVGNVLAGRGPELDELKYFSLDLSQDASARVKVYARHHHCTPDEVAAASTGGGEGSGHVVRAFLRDLAPDVDRYDGRGPFTCYAFVSESASRPGSVTTHFPVNGYANSDAVIRERVLSAHELLGIDPGRYLACLDGTADGSFGGRVGRQSYASLRQHESGACMTVYLPTEVYAPGTVEDPRPARRGSGVTPKVAPFAGLELRGSPLYRLLAEDAGSLRALWVLVGNLRLALEPLGRELEAVTREAPDASLRRLLAELSQASHWDGDLAAAHDGWLLGAECALAAQDHAEPNADLLAPGEAFAAVVEQCIARASIYARIGSAVAGVVLANDACNAVGHLARRLRPLSAIASDGFPTLPQPMVPPWTLLQATPAEDQDEVQRGIVAMRCAAWTLFNDLYAACLRVAP